MLCKKTWVAGLAVAVVFAVGFPLSTVAKEVIFKAAPYEDMLNNRAGEYYEAIKNSGISFSDAGAIRLTPGKHRLIIKGREEGARLEGLWLGKVGENPEKHPGTFIEIDKGSVVAPLKLAHVYGVTALVGVKNQGQAVYEFEVPAEGAYALWGKAGGPDHDANSFSVGIDAMPDFIWDFPLEVDRKTTWNKIKGRGVDYYGEWHFLLAWGATALHGRYRNDMNFRQMAMALTEAFLPLIANRKVQPAQLWFLRDLEAVRLWHLDDRTPPTVVARMLEKIRPYVNNCYDMTQSPEGWRENTPNIQIQAAAILQLAAVMWKDSDPEASAKWSAAASKCLDLAWKWKLPHGPFVYSYGSGIDAGYFSQDAKHLTRLYLLTGEVRVKDALQDMAVAAVNTTSYGHPLSFGAPWWKHTFWQYNQGDSFMIIGLILALSGDSSYAAMLQMDQLRNLRPPLPSNTDWLIPYYNTMLPEIKTEVKPIENQSYFSLVENGPALRFNHLNVAMPWRSWCESTCGVAYSVPEQVRSQVCSVSLVAISPDIEGKIARAHYPIAYSVVEQVNPKPEARAIIFGGDFIASASAFRPALAGPALPGNVNKINDSPWLRTDIWFADRDGCFGTLELQALRDNNCSKVALWTHASDELKIAGNRVELPGIEITLNGADGKISNLGPTWGFSGGFYPLTLLEVPIREVAGFNKGDVFRATVDMRVADGKKLADYTVEAKDGVVRVEIRREGKPGSMLLFNGSLTEKTWTIKGPLCKAVQSSSASGPGQEITVIDTIKLPVGSLTVIK